MSGNCSLHFCVFYYFFIDNVFLQAVKNVKLLRNFAKNVLASNSDSVIYTEKSDDEIVVHI